MEKKDTVKKWLKIFLDFIALFIGSITLIFNKDDGGNQVLIIISVLIYTVLMSVSIFVRILQFKEFKIIITRKNKDKNKGYIDIMTTFLNKQFNRNTIALAGISIFMLAYILMHVILSKEINYAIPIFLIIMSVIIGINQSLTIYRVKKQYFGTSYDEAREILYFVKKSKDKDSNNGKFIFTDEQPEIPAANEQTEYS